MTETAELVAIGKIEKPFGVKGEVRVRSLSDVPGRFEGLTQVTLVAPSGRALVAGVTRVRADGNSYVLGFDAFTTPEEAAVFRGWLIKIPRDLSPPLPAGQPILRQGQPPSAPGAQRPGLQSRPALPRPARATPPPKNKKKR